MQACMRLHNLNALFVYDNEGGKLHVYRHSVLDPNRELCHYAISNQQWASSALVIFLEIPFIKISRNFTAT
jgi:hypothetical protein